MGAEMLPAPIRGNDVVGGGSALFEHRLHWGGGGLAAGRPRPLGTQFGSAVGWGEGFSCMCPAGSWLWSQV